jgi:transposase
MCFASRETLMNRRASSMRRLLLRKVEARGSARRSAARRGRIEAKPEKLIGDKAYDSDDLDDDLKKNGIDIIASHRSNRRPEHKTQDGRKLRRYERRWLVERFFAWIQWHRRVLVRWEYYAENFLGFVQLTSICVLLKQF